MTPDRARAELGAIGARVVSIERRRATLAADLGELIPVARAAGISAAEISGLTGLSRAWLYRRYRAEMTGDAKNPPT